MVIGHNKSLAIAKNELLQWYYNLFSNELKGKNTRLIVIGYSFNDKHVNDAIINSGCELCVIDRLRRVDLLSGIKDAEQRDKINKILTKYYCKTILELINNGNVYDPDFTEIVDYITFKD